MQSIVLLSGPVAVGKTTLRDLLAASYGFDYVRSSPYLIQVAAERGIGTSREDLQDLGDELDRSTDFRWVVDQVATPTFRLRPEKSRWLVDAVRKQRQIDHFRSAFDGAILHVHLTAGEDVLRARFDGRLKAANLHVDGRTPYEAAIQHDNEVQARRLIASADLVVDLGITSTMDAAEMILQLLPR